MNASSRFSVFFACFVATVVPSTAAAAGNPVNGGILYADHCASCHMAHPDFYALMAANKLSKLQGQIATNPDMMIPDLQALTVSQLTDIVTFLGTFIAPPPPPAALNFQGIWWLPTESGWGINLAHQGDTIFASWFTYDTTGKGMWLVMTAPKTGTGVYSGHLLATHGPRFDAFDTTKFQYDDVGTGTLTFTDVNNGTFHYHINNGPVDQTKTITRQVFGTLPLCTYGTQPANFAAATNYTDLWWAKPGGSEAGWGINLNHESNTIFATWFTYDIDGTPMWLVASVTGPAFSGPLLRTRGPRFDAYDPNQFHYDQVGTVMFIFADGNTASFHYDITAVGPAEVSQTKTITRQPLAALGTTCQ